MSNFKVAIFLAYKSIKKGNRWTLILIITVMSLSFASLILTPSIMAGVTKSLDEQQINALSGNIVVEPALNKYYLEDLRQTEVKIEQIPGVIGVSPRLDTSAFIEYQWLEKNSPSDRGRSGNWQIVGIDPQKEASVTTIHNEMIQGSYLDESDRGKIIMGIEIAGGDGAQSGSDVNLGGVRIEDKVRLTYPNGIQREYEVKGIFRTREMAADHTAFVTRKEMVSVMGRQAYNDRASQILVKTDPAHDENTILGELKASSIEGEIKSWQEYGGSSEGIVSSFDAIASLITAIGLVVAGIVMFIVIYINVINKKRQIGILRAIGINSRIILYSYLSQALFYAVIGMILGGLVFYFGIHPYFAIHPIDVPIGLVSLSINLITIRNAVLGIILAAVLAGIIPVLSVIRQSIINAIWGN